MLSISYLISFLIGFLILQLVLGSRGGLDLLLKSSLALILGLGTGGVTTFFSFLIFGKYLPSAIVSLNIILLIILAFLNRRSISEQLLGLIPSFKRVNLFNTLLVAAVVACFAVFAYLIATWIPYGRWDAWSMYNMKPKFLIFGGTNWTALFNGLHWHTQPDYPLLLPFITTWLSAFTRPDIHQIALTNAILLTLNCGILLFAGLRQRIPKTAALIAFIIIAFNPKFLILATAQYADVLLASFLLGTMITLVLSNELNSWRLAGISGFCAGFMPFTKNEGFVLAFLIAFISTIILLIKARRDKTALKILAALLTGLLLSASAAIIFKLFLAPPNRDMMGKVVFSQLQFFNWNGFLITFNAFKDQFLHPEWSYIWVLLSVLLIFGIKKLFRTPYLIITAFFIFYISILFYIYMTTRNFDLSWRISVSIDRICFYLLPTFAFWSFTAAFKKGPFLKGFNTAIISNSFNNALTKIKQSPLFFSYLGIFCIMIAAYLPVLVTEYVYHDDVNLFLKSPLQPLPVSTRTNFIVYGRFLGAIIYTLTSWPIRFISDLQFLRLFTIIQLMFSAGMIYPYVKKLLPNKWPAVLLTGTFFTLPPFQVLVANAGMSFDAAGTLFASLACVTVDKISSEITLLKRVRQRTMLLAIFFFFCSLTVHQATAMFYWGFAALIILTYFGRTFTEIKNKAVDFFIAGFAGLGIYAVLLKLMKPLSLKYVSGMNNPFEMRLDIFAQLKWFFKEPVSNALNLWSVYPSEIFAALAKLIIVSGVIIFLLELFQEKSGTPEFKKDIKKTALITMLIAVWLILSFLPNLITVARQPLYRCLSGVYLIIFMLLIWSILQWLRVFSAEKLRKHVTVFCALLALFAIFVTCRNLVLYRVIPSHTLTQFLKKSFSIPEIGKYRRVHFFHPRIDSLKTRWDEFGMITVGYDHDWMGLIACGLIESNRGKKDFKMVLMDHSRKTTEFYFVEKNGEKKLDVYEFKISGSEYIPNMPYDPSVLALDYSQFFAPGGRLKYLIKK